MPSGRRYRDAMRRLLALLSPPPAGTALDAAAGWREEEWTDLLRLANRLWLGGALEERLRAHGLAAAPPPAVRDHAEGVAELTRQRAAAQTRQALRLAARLNAEGMEPVFLKGTAALLDGLHPDPAARLCSDIDLLLPAGAVPGAVAALRAQGYTHDPRGPAAERPHDKHAPRLFHPREPFGVEIHRHLADAMLRPALAADEALAAAVPLAGGGVRMRVLRPDHRVRHCALHLIGDQRAGRPVALRQLVELDALLRRHPPDWAGLAGAVARVRHGTRLEALLLLCAALLSTPLPPLCGGFAARALAEADRLGIVAVPAFARLRATGRILAGRLHPPALVRAARTVATSPSPWRTFRRCSREALAAGRRTT